MASRFPDYLDNFETFINISASDGNAIKQYQEAMKNGDSTAASKALKTIPNANKKIITAAKLNDYVDATNAVEKFYKDDIKPYATQKQNEWKSIVDQFSYQGVYSSSKTYKQNNYVSYGVGSNTFLYIALIDVPTGTEPTNDFYWTQLTVAGKQGEPGTGIAFRGEWDASTSYTLNNCVEYKGGLWNATRSSTNQAPSSSSAYWKVVYELSSKAFPLSSSRPTGQGDGDLWFKII